MQVSFLKLDFLALALVAVLTAILCYGTKASACCSCPAAQCQGRLQALAWHPFQSVDLDNCLAGNHTLVYFAQYMQDYLCFNMVISQCCTVRIPCRSRRASTPSSP
jgi:hypothetical protein